MKKSKPYPQRIKPGTRNQQQINNPRDVNFHRNTKGRYKTERILKR